LPRDYDINMPATIITVTLNPAIDRVIEVDGFAVGTHQVGRELLRVPAGKGVNVSRVLAAMDVPSTATGFLGVENFAAYQPLFGGLITDAFVRLPGRTRENITITDRRTRQDTHIRDVGLSVDAAAMDRLKDTLCRLAAPESLFIFSGSLPPGVTPGAFAELVTGCLNNGARVAVDTSGTALTAVASLPLWLAKPNTEELPQLVGRDVCDDQGQVAAARSLSVRVANVLLTCGRQGAYLFTGDVAMHAVAPLDATEIVSTVGCGDVILAAYVAGVHKGTPVTNAFSEAVAYAAACAMTFDPAGTDPAAVQTCRQRLRISEVAGGED